MMNQRKPVVAVDEGVDRSLGKQLMKTFQDSLGTSELIQKIMYKSYFHESLLPVSITRRTSEAE